MATTTNRNLQALKRKLERMELEHLRQHALELHERLEQAEARAFRAESEAADAWESADFWQRDAMNMQEALLDPEYANARQIGVTKSGELLVVRTGGDHGQH